LDLRKIKKLIELVQESGISELEVKAGEEAIRIARYSTAPLSLPVASATAPQPVQNSGVAIAADRGGASAAGGAGQVINAPMAGTFYRAPAPGADPFVSEGQDVGTGDVVCIIESMKMMNQIEAERRGRVSEILVADGEPIEAGQPLFRLT